MIKEIRYIAKLLSIIIVLFTTQNEICAQMFTYDLQGRLTGALYHDGSKLNYGYDPAGNIWGFSSAVLAGRRVFYNNSAWDGNSTVPNANDDKAIAHDKSALRRGAKAAFANYTSFSKGINGVMIDIPILPGTPTGGDFIFKVGNNNTPSTWATAPTPTSITVRHGAGTDGSDRVTIIWPDGAIKKQWIEVTVLATERTGLVAPDILYFGNAIGDTGNMPNDALVNAHDESGTRANPRGFSNPAPLTLPYDFNRDKVVNAMDVSILRANVTGFSTALRLIDLTSLPSGSPVESGASDTQDKQEESPLALKFQMESNSQSAEVNGQAIFSPSIKISDGQMRIQFVGSSPSQYRLQTTSAIGSDWQDLDPQPLIEANGEFIEVIIPASSEGPQRFYRILRSSQSLEER